MEYKKLNNYIGWAVFIIATMVYVLTLEGTTSLWDCGEYITTAYKLEVGHPPGAPLFMMLGRLFTVFVGPESAAYMVNLMSALSSSFTILFLFWSITMIAKKITLSPNDNLFSKEKSNNIDERTSLIGGEIWAVLGSGIIGALAYTFTDSFWFSAVEGEVYAMSSFFTAIVVWAILKWESELTDQSYFPDDEEIQSKHANRWIIFIFFMVGLSIGVHLLNLLCIPAIAYIIYFKKYKSTGLTGFIATGIIGVITLGIIQSVIIPVTISLAGSFERVFKNSLGMPFNSGAIFFFILITALIIGLLVFSRKKQNVVLNTITWSGTMLLIGYTCFAMIVIRSNANPPLDENDPENLVSLESYLKREQYGDWPILYGQYFNAKAIARKDWADKSDVYMRRWVVQNKNAEKDLAGFETEAEANAYAAKSGGVISEKYYKTYDGRHQKPTFDPKSSTFFPRMYGSEDRHVRGYTRWTGVNATRTPKFSDNLGYFMSYQINWMYWRYFMWNFSGRQSDEQGHGNPKDGNWITGLNFIDKHHVGDQTLVPSIISNNPSHNKFYMLPLILGLIGFIFTLTRASKSWWFIMLLFLLTGFAVILYLNQKPYEPRERDYAYAASFYAFSFWIGLSVLGLFKAFKDMKWPEFGKIGGVLLLVTLILAIDGPAASISMLYMSAIILGAYALMIGLRKSIQNDVQIGLLLTLICLPVPIIMGVQGWDDHNRSGRYTAQALAHNYLIGCNENSILFTNGDNDTFPLWYLQEVEGKHTSVRVCNLSLFSTDWYTAQMKRKAYESEPLPISFEEHEFRQHKSLDVVYVQGSSSLTMNNVNELPREVKAIMQKKIDSNPKEYATGFKKACDNLYAVLLQTNLKTKQPALLENLKTFNTTGTFFGFRDFAFKLLKEPAKFGLNEHQQSSIQKLLVDFNDSFDYLPLEYVIAYLHDEKNRIVNQGEKLYALPTRGFTVKIDKSKASSVVSEADQDKITDELRWKLPKGKNHLLKAEIMMLDIINNFNWERDLYFAGSASPSTYLGLQKYFYTEGLIYKLVPLNVSKNKNPNSLGEMNKAVSYTNLMEKYVWGNMEKEGVLVDYYTRRGTNNYRVQFSVLADAFAEDYTKAQRKIDFIQSVENDSISGELKSLENIQAETKTKVVTLLDKAQEVMPPHKVPYSSIMPYYIGTYYSVGAIEEGEKLAFNVLAAYEEEMAYYLDIDEEFSGAMLDEVTATFRSIFTIFQTVNLIYKSKNEELTKRLEDDIQNYIAVLESKKSAFREAGASTSYTRTIGAFLNQITSRMP